MWLVDTATLALKEIVNLDDCKYAILSHTWQDEEISFHDMRAQSEAVQSKAGFRKIKKTCEVAREKGYSYAWVDTCCIDKTSSAELSEAINSMFSWYKQSSICLAYLCDLPANNNFEDDESETAKLMRKCRWFARGWTLQELLAPEALEFYDQEWRYRGTKEGLRRELSAMTGIDEDVLANSDLLPTVPVGRRMSWAAHRKTTRVEDAAYCMFGLFGVSMPVIYGEGSKAFLRLQEEIIKDSNDLTLFAWTAQHAAGAEKLPVRQSHAEGKQLRGILAHSPAEFADCSRLKIAQDSRGMPAKEFRMTNIGLRIEAALGSSPARDCILSLDCVNEIIPKGNRKEERLGIYLLETEAGFVRTRSDEVFATTNRAFWHGPRTTAYIARDLTAAVAARLRDQLCMSMKFVFDVRPANTYTLRDIVARPLALWDKTNNMFRTGNRSNFTACVEFTIRPRYMRFVIVCGLIDTASDNPPVTDAWVEQQPPYHHHHNSVSPWMAIFSHQEHHGEQKLAVIDRILNKTSRDGSSNNNNLRKLREQVLAWHAGRDGRVSLRAMATAPKTAYDHGLGEGVRYSMDVVVGQSAAQGGSSVPVYNMRVFISEFHGMVHDAASTTLGNVGSDDEAAVRRQHKKKQAAAAPPRVPPAPRRRNASPPAAAAAANPFAPRPAYPPDFNGPYARGAGGAAVPAPPPPPPPSAYVHPGQYAAAAAAPRPGQLGTHYYYTDPAYATPGAMPLGFEYYGGGGGGGRQPPYR